MNFGNCYNKKDESHENFYLSQQPLSDTSSTGSPPAMHRNNKYDLTEIPDFQQPHVRPCEYLIAY